MLQRFGILDEDTHARAATDADHDRHGRGKAERTGAGNDEHGDGGDKTIGEARLRSPDAPARESEDRDENDSGDEPA